MIALLKRLLWDETAALGLVRAACLGVGTAVATGQLDVAGLPRWAGVALLALGGYVRSSSLGKPAR